MASLLWTYEDGKSNTSNVILCPAELSNFWYKLLMLAKIIKQNDIIKEDVISAYCFTQTFYLHSFINRLWNWTGRIFPNSLFLGEVTCSYNRLWEFSVTKSICYKDVFANSFCSPTFRSSNSLVVEPFLRSSHRRCSLRKSVLRNFTKFTRKYLCQSLFLNKVTGLMPATLLKKRLWHSCFLVNFVKFLRKPFLKNTSWRLLLFPLNSHLNNF